MTDANTPKKQPAALHNLCAFCHQAEATITLEAKVPGVPNSTSLWEVCEQCAAAVRERMPESEVAQ